MPLHKCTLCYHEWEGPAAKDICDWCGSPGEILVKETAFDKYVRERKWNKIGDAQNDSE